MADTNPFLSGAELPDFPALQPRWVEPAITQILDDNRKAIDALLEAVAEPTWQNLVLPLEELEDRLEKA